MVFPPTPDERDPRYFRTWQRVSVVLQKSFRQWVRELYFRDIARFADRDEAFVMIVFSVCRPCYGTPRSEFTYDAADPETLTTARRSIGQALRNALAPIEKRLYEAGETELSHRYAPVWYQDVLVAVKKRERYLLALLAQESRLIDAVINLGTRRDPEAQARFDRTAANALRNFHNIDMRELIPKILEETARLLS